MARRVTRSVHDLKRQSTESETLTFEEPFGRHLIPIEGQTIRRSLEGAGLEHPYISLVQVNGNVEVLAQGLHRADMVEMRMRQPDCTESGTGLLHTGDQSISIISRVHHRRFTAVAIDDEPGVLLKGTGLEPDDLERRIAHAGSVASRRAERNFSAAMAAVVASPTAVVTCRVSCTRTSPAAYSPGIEVAMFVSVRR